MIYKKLIFEMKKKKWDNDPTGIAKAFDFTIRKEGNKKPLFEMGVVHYKEESARRMAEGVFIRKLYNKEIKI